MKVYRVRYLIDGDWVNEWYATKAEAKEAMKEIKKDERGEDAVVFEPEVLNIPTDKKGLVRWLNFNDRGARL